MAILDLQRRIAEAGRIRLGVQMPTGNGNTRPAKLETFRLTSPDKLRIDQAAGLWGGQVEPWDDAPAGRQWQVVTEATSLDVIVPPADMAFSQSYELWSAGGCRRRCDGVTETLSGGPCLCDPDKRECDIHTRLSVMLRDLNGLGVWRVDTQGYYAAVELQGAVQVIEIAAGRGQLLPARLLLVQRQVKRIVNDKPQTRKFAVPVLDIEVTPGQLLAAPGTGPLALPAGNTDLPGPSRDPAQGQTSRAGEPIDGQAPLSRSLTPVPASVQHRPAGSVAQQMKASTVPQERKRRANSAQPVPATGVEPRTAAQAYADNAERERNGNGNGNGPIREYLPGPTSDPEPLIDPDCRDGKHSSCVGSPCQCPCHSPAADDGPGKVTPQQVRVLFAALTRHGFNAQKEPDTLLQVIETLAGRELTGPNKAVSGNPRTTKNLTRAEADKVVAQLDECDSQAAVWELVGQLAGDKPPF